MYVYPLAMSFLLSCGLMDHFFLSTICKGGLVVFGWKITFLAWFEFFILRFNLRSPKRVRIKIKWEELIRIVLGKYTSLGTFERKIKSS